MKRPMPPCGRNCQKRHARCHSECDPYKVYEKESKAFRDERHKKQATTDALNQLKDHCVRSVTHGDVRYYARKYST